MSKQDRLAAAMRLPGHLVTPVLRQLTRVLTYRQLADWLESLGEPTSLAYLVSIVEPQRRRGRGGDPDGSGPIPPVPGRRAA